MSANGRLDPAVYDEAEMWAAMEMQRKINEMWANLRWLVPIPPCADCGRGDGKCDRTEAPKW